MHLDSAEGAESHQDAVRGALILPGGDILSWSDDTTLKIWDMTSGVCHATLRGHTAPVEGALVLPDGDILSWSDDCSLKLWDRETGAAKSSADCDFPLHGAALLPDGSILFWGQEETGTMGVFAIGEPDLSEVRRNLEGHEYPVDGARILADGRVMSWSKDCTLKIWNADTGEILRTFQLSTDPATGVLVPDGAIELGNGNILSWQHDIVRAYASSLKVWDLATGTCLATIDAHEKIITSVCLRHDGRLVSASHDGTVKLWEPTDEKLHQSFKQRGWEGRLAREPQVPRRGALWLSELGVLSWGEDRSLEIWCCADTAAYYCWCSLEGHSAAVVGACLLPDGRVLSWSEDSTLRLWDADESLELRCFGVAKEDQSPSGDMLVDFLMLAGIWPAELDPMTCCDDDEPLPQEVVEACQRLFEALERNPDLWLEVPHELGARCFIVDNNDPRGVGEDRTRVGVLPIDCLDELPGLSDYPWYKRGPLWYSSGLTINDVYTGPILFLRDGWVGVDPNDSESFTLNSWDYVHDHVWPNSNSRGEVSPTLMKLGCDLLDYDAIRAPTWAALSFQLADIILRRILPAARESRGKLGIKHPPILQWTEERIRAILTGEE